MSARKNSLDKRRVQQQSVTVYVSTGLHREEAIRRGWPKAKAKGKTDFRGFTYDKRTGKATFT